ncbi:SRPBCC family protein [Phytoactinopolyspora halotolerans]|uniref:SRPBCC family protein n=1 Tax=Phytoactinopolyspora halotolerans TaxID=1981512 RepID=A0A6L9S5Q2_9ACTN|nr:SRPBCC family protein [Phytoactinopolyspora halotolerans]NED99821.1 SRPBCC family protein [Phytoactinopolyspora halotolerans]
MSVQRIDVSVTTPAKAATVYALLRDGAGWPSWSPIERFELLRASDDDGGEGVGAVRLFRTGRIRSVERIVELVPERRLSYTLEKGLAIRGYRADIDLAEGPEGTTIRWRSSFRAKVPGTGWLYRRTLATFIRRCADGLAEHASGMAR